MSLLLFATVALSLGAFASPIARRGEEQKAQTVLAQSALAEILKQGAPILGYDEGCSRSNATCDWMANYSDDTKIVHMSIPGTHDAATWNYTQATQDEFIRYTGEIAAAEYYQCQEHSLFQMLNGGIRAFDLRVAYNPGNDTIGFHHSEAMLSPTATVEDVFFGFYSWLDKHPTEALLISVNHESSTGTPDDAKLYEHLYDLFNSSPATEYWVQTNGTLGTLGEARGKMTLLQRFSYDLLPAYDTNRIGIYLDADQWTDNGVNITLVYNEAEDQVAYIEDYYDIGVETGAGAAENILWKYNATTAHIQDAIDNHPDQLYISFASSEHDVDSPAETPRIMALGNGTDVPGVNQKLLPWLQERNGSRFGIIMLDFFDSVPGLVEAILSV
ncbi:PLC-like phosphodiesterase [Guyanagaster necrorhizus]|uniref:PLC-like phosphodiesterase n=1 Tax=Guyanagaster necrorhizus TaxID=856835 RepID=A0A9P8AN73_9AGAR|nr:PLC-like phosphodiesterase [Guyanagaster necrorhizus MCA 3950]KAG7441529.1 PLC-like phosphodiesterase [Guyanagaster necrorhizus MCA 3950]